MATVTFVPATGTHRTASNELTLMASTTLTTSPVVSTSDALTLGWEYVVFHLTYTKGSETTARFYVEGYTGTGWKILAIDNALSSNLVDTVKHIRTFTPGNYGTADAFSLSPVSVIGYQKIRTYIYYSGGSAPGAIAVSATAGNTVKLGA